MEKFVVKIASEKEAEYILSLAFEHGWKWFDDDRAVKPNGQKIKNSAARYLMFGYKGPGLISWFGRVKKNIPPANVLNARTQLPRILSNLADSKVLHIGADVVNVEGDVATVGCKTFKSETVLELLELSKRVSALNDAYIFHANGDVTNHGRRVSAYLLQRIADAVL
jgi:hypothetical protein